MNEFCIFTADEKSENTKQKAKSDRQTWCNFWAKKNELRDVKDLPFPLLILRKKVGVAFIRILNEVFSGTWTQKVQRYIYWRKTTLNFPKRIWNPDESNWWSNIGKVIIHKPPEKWERLKRSTFSPKESLATRNNQLWSVLPSGFRLEVWFPSQS